VAIKELHRRGMSSLILDLRDNRGGILDQAVKIAEEFLPVGSTVISQRGRSSSDNREWKSENRDPENLPLVLLVNSQTASASEVVAGALQDNDRALIIGQNTFGKGLVQNVVGLPMGSGLTLTTARYYTPSGRSIQRSYASTGAYDYFSHRLPVSGAPLRPEARTVTNRTVYGGNGIAPDELFEAQKFDVQKAALLDPIFFFVRDVVSSAQPSTINSISPRDQIRQSIIFGKPPFGQDLLKKFLDYVNRTEAKVSEKAINEHSDFIVQRLNYELALATFGPEAAKHSLIDSDAEIAKAIDALPRAASLAEMARKARISTHSKKTRRVAFPTGQVRNRRN
jgi:carboxyl-terminal processing protease